MKENKLHKYVFEKSEGSKLEIEDIVNPLKEKEEDNDNKKIRFMMMGKDKNYMFYKNSVKHIPKVKLLIIKFSSIFTKLQIFRLYSKVFYISAIISGI